MTDEELSGLIGRIYDCALDPALWPDVLTALCREMDFRMASLILAAQPYDRTLLDITVGITAEERAGMLAFGRAAVEAWGPPGTLAALGRAASGLFAVAAALAGRRRLRAPLLVWA